LEQLAEKEIMRRNNVEVDATYNAGRFWKGSKRRVVSMDIDPQHKPMIVGDVSSAPRRRQINT